MTVDPDALFAANHHRLFQYFCRAVGETDTARDLTQDVFLRVTRATIPAGGDGDVRARLFRIARNLALDHHRERARRPRPVALEDDGSRVPSQDVDLAVNQALATLPDLDRDVFLMREVGGLGYDDIGRTCELTPDAVRSRMVGAELWLVERLANGSQAQRSQPLTLRGLPNHPFSFYFDRVVDGASSLDVYGILKTRLTGGAIGLDVETRIRWKGPSDRLDFIGPQRTVNAKFGVDPTDIVEIELPPLEDDSGPFAKRKFSIRVRTRQLR